MTTPTGARRGAGRLPRAAAAFVILAALLAGLPWALWQLGGWPLPWPRRTPHYGAPAGGVPLPPSDPNLPRAVLVALWVGWALVAFATARAVRDVRRGGPPARARAPRRAMALLVGAVLMTGRPAAPGPARTGPDLATLMAAALGEPTGPPTAAPPAAPAARTGPASPGPVPPEPDAGPGEGAPALAPLPPSRHAPPKPATPDPRPPQAAQVFSPVGTTVGTGAYLGLGTVALLVGALAHVRLWRRRRYTPRSAERADLTTTTTGLLVDAAYRAAAHDPGEADSSGSPGAAHGGKAEHGDRDVRVLGRAHDTAAIAMPPPPSRVVGSRDGEPVTVDLAAARGLGLVGPGAADAARALVVAMLTERHRPGAIAVELLITERDAIGLLGAEAAVAEVPWLRLVPDLRRLASELATDLQIRSLRAHLTGDWWDAAGEPTLLVVATPEPPHSRWMRALLGHGGALGTVGVLLGPWPFGTTVDVRADGTVAAAVPDDGCAGGALVGARMFTCPPGEVNGLLGLLADADTPGTETARLAEVEVTPAGVVPMSFEQGRRRYVAPEPFPSSRAGAASRQGAAVSLDRVRPDRWPDPDPVPRFLLRLLGPAIELTYQAPGRTDLVPVRVKRQGRHLLAYLALHPGGVRRDALIFELWPDDTHRDLIERFYAVLSDLRKPVREVTGDPEAGLVVSRGILHVLDSDVVDVDVWRLRDALRDHDHLHRDGPGPSLAAAEKVLAAYTGDLTDELDALWAAPLREHLRRDVLDALTHTASMIGPKDPAGRLALLEKIRRVDPYVENTYCQIAQTQAHLGLDDAVARTHDLLRATLAEIDAEPSPDTAAMFAGLLRW